MTEETAIEGRIYPEGEWQEHQMDIKHEFNDDAETFEVYECPSCKSHFLVESEVFESISEMYCPYCKTVFKGDDDGESTKSGNL
jgi:hypothetical protein